MLEQQMTTKTLDRVVSGLHIMSLEERRGLVARVSDL
jgi:hypothetical protein